MTFAILEIITHSCSNGVTRFHLSATKELTNEIIYTIAKYSNCEESVDGTYFETKSTHKGIPIRILLNWIKSKGYKLHTVLPSSGACHDNNGVNEKYIFEIKMLK